MRLALLGDPVEHSLSPAIHTAALAALAIPGSYVARRVDDEGMAAAVAEIRSGGLDGANVTMPHKQTAARLADDLTDDAVRTASVNTLYRHGGAVGGANTDVTGIRVAWARAGLPEDGPVLILGGGGAAAAALVALEGRHLALSTRRPEAAVTVLERVGVMGAPYAWGHAYPGAVIVNATPLGMSGEPLPAGLVEKSAGLFEMAYASSTTPAVAAARRMGIPCSTGQEMLLGQAIESFEIWTGRKAPAEAMREALAQVEGAAG